MSETATWLASLKVGDAVIVNGHNMILRKVERVTPTQIIVQGSAYRKDTGRKKGPYQGWHHPALVEATADRLATIKREWAIATLKYYRWDEMSLDNLLAVVAITQQQERDSAASHPEAVRTDVHPQG